jgi:hypothetical protein
MHTGRCAYRKWFISSIKYCLIKVFLRFINSMKYYLSKAFLWNSAETVCALYTAARQTRLGSPS